MNKIRRKELSEIIDRIQAITNDLENILSEEEDYRDNMPENLQSSEKYETSDNACSFMQDAIDNLNEAMDNIGSSAE